MQMLTTAPQPPPHRCILFELCEASLYDLLYSPESPYPVGTPLPVPEFVKLLREVGARDGALLPS